MFTAISIAWKSIIIALVVLALKVIAAWLSDSVALYSDAVESIVNVVTAIAAFTAILIAARPPDTNHPYGHEKAEYFVAMVEAVLIGAAAFAILSQAWFTYNDQKLLNVPAEAFGANILAGIINGVWCLVLIRRGRAMRSSALEAEGWHLFSDVMSSVGVLAGIFAAKITGIAILDPLLAVFVAANILWSGWKLMKTSVLGLMDTAPDDGIIDTIRKTIAQEGNGALEAHDLRARLSGPVTFIEFHLVVDGKLSVNEAHNICDRIEDRLLAELPNSRIIIHVEPEYKAEEHNSINI
jgi:cation diffusion facilitator family transporter